MTLTDFLLARIEEDEEDARAATQGDWHWTGDYPSDPYKVNTCVHTTEWTNHGPDLMAGDTPIGVASGYDASSFSIKQEDGDHIVRWQPARVLAECEAKRQIVEYSTLMLKAWKDRPNGTYPDMTRRERHTARLTLETLAFPYTYHADYRKVEDP